MVLEGCQAWWDLQKPADGESVFQVLTTSEDSGSNLSENSANTTSLPGKDWVFFLLSEGHKMLLCIKS